MTAAQRRQLDQARQSEAAARVAMLDAMRAMGFEAVCECFTGHVMGRPDASAEDVHDALQRAARIAWAEVAP